MHVILIKQEVDNIKLNKAQIHAKKHQLNPAINKNAIKSIKIAKIAKIPPKPNIKLDLQPSKTAKKDSINLKETIKVQIIKNPTRITKPINKKILTIGIKPRGTITSIVRNEQDQNESLANQTTVTKNA